MTAPAERRPFLARTGTVVAIASTVVGMAIAYLTLAAALKWPPFQPSQPAVPKSVAVYRGTGANGQPNCENPACAFIGIELQGFPPDKTVRCSYDSSSGPSAFLDSIGRTDQDGFMRKQSQNYFGTPGGWVSVTCDEVRGELSPW